MSGIAALAAAAAATQKINTTAGVTTTPVSGIKVVTPTVVSSSGVKVTPVSGRTSELVVSSMLVCFHRFKPFVSTTSITDPFSSFRCNQCR